MRLAAFVTVIVVLAVAWYLISPLFINRQVSEAFPTLAHMPTKTALAAQTEAAAEGANESAQATAAMQVAMTEVPPAAADDMPENAGAEMKVLLSGEYTMLPMKAWAPPLFTNWQMAAAFYVSRILGFSTGLICTSISLPKSTFLIAALMSWPTK